MLEIQQIDSKCVGCGACYNICPVQAISMGINKEGFLYPNVDETVCTSCYSCEGVCPVLIAPVPRENYARKAYYGWSENPEIRKNSSSGGAFTVLSNMILDQQGIVYGAKFDAERQILFHTHTDGSSLESLRKSKYLESDTGLCFSEIKDHLNRQRPVLYCGTPCQVAGLHAFLGDISKEQLLTIDFVCHGVPPVLLFQEHIAHIEKKTRSRLKNVDFRPKSLGWSKHSLKMKFENGKERDTPWKLDYYFLLFYNSLSLRKSCYTCDFIRNHQSDLILADFWRIATYKPALNDQKGISLILSNTRKGEKYLDVLKQNFTLHELPMGEAEYIFTERNPQKHNKERRDQFFASWQRHGYRKTVKRLYGKEVAVRNTKMTIKNLLGRNT